VCSAVQCSVYGGGYSDVSGSLTHTHTLTHSLSVFDCVRLCSTSQVIGLLEKRADEVQEDGSSSLDYIFVDTPGQIEAFTW
jgi:hypothetical protein